VASAGQVVVTEACAAQLGNGFRLGDLPPLAVKGKALSLRVYQVLPGGPGPARFEDDALLEATEDKGHFEVPRTQAAGYAPIEPAAQPADEPRHAG
jgi:hypothetical protein